MANTLRIKRRAVGGAAGAPSSLANAELAYNEQDDTLYYGKGTGGAGGTATNVIPIGGVATGNFSVLEADGKLIFKCGGTVIASMSSAGVLSSLGNIASNGTP